MPRPRTPRPRKEAAQVMHEDVILEGIKRQTFKWTKNINSRLKMNRSAYKTFIKTTLKNRTFLNLTRHHDPKP